MSDDKDVKARLSRFVKGERPVEGDDILLEACPKTLTIDLSTMREAR